MEGEVETGIEDDWGAEEDEVEVDEVVGGAGCGEERRLTARTFILSGFRGGGGGDTRKVDTTEELEGGGRDSTGQKIMSGGFFFFRAFFGTAKSSSSESDLDGFKTSSVEGGGTSIFDENQKD